MSTAAWTRNSDRRRIGRPRQSGPGRRARRRRRSGRVRTAIPLGSRSVEAGHRARSSSRCPSSISGDRPAGVADGEDSWSPGPYPDSVSASGPRRRLLLEHRSRTGHARILHVDHLVARDHAADRFPLTMSETAADATAGRAGGGQQAISRRAVAHVTTETSSRLLRGGDVRRVGPRSSGWRRPAGRRRACVEDRW